MITEPFMQPAPRGPFKSSSRNGTRIDTVIIHDTASHSAASALDWWSRPTTDASAHCLIDRDGTTYRVVSDDRTAWHAGISELWGDTGLNRRSLGVELVDWDPGSGAGDAYPEPQLAAAVQVVAWWVVTYRIPLNRVVGHQHVAPKRRRDPGPDFPWREFLLAVARHAA